MHVGHTTNKSTITPIRIHQHVWLDLLHVVCFMDDIKYNCMQVLNDYVVAMSGRGQLGSLKLVKAWIQHAQSNIPCPNDGTHCTKELNLPIVDDVFNRPLWLLQSHHGWHIVHMWCYWGEPSFHEEMDIILCITHNQKFRFKNSTRRVLKSPYATKDQQLQVALITCTCGSSCRCKCMYACCTKNCDTLDEPQLASYLKLFLYMP